ncbi:DNA alkylation repair protein [Paenibacillus macquariensis]|uniref:3-methyladenine DNA glycosylase AlkD n=1 Tax=Paenibacillus macquariensis TaxID=948756 RepID=A0ABY1JP36_9BACL|nr:DNA alkylation repair protein [Paenibacillus macquariensis]MEC0092061.1 DNA alkylation repair protein [Paenibacillus macquariensis]OAB37372.1 DNA alkylation repair protein [Paenibacillus macquariensis subsp. macquariensis]SIQ51828.1 3-methyladenine DNA glycosylase AlkD [Paenibacillus macquariensis]
METTIREQLVKLVDKEYQKFSSALIPNINNIIGIRLPELRKLAKNIAKGDWRSYLEHTECEYFEEIMLQGMVIGYAKADIEEILPYVAAFVPRIDNWSVCDSFCIGLKFTKSNMKQVWEFLQPYLSSDKEYEIRFGVVMLLNFYIEEEYIEQVLLRLDNIEHEGYYVKMAVAWAISICYIKLPESTIIYLASNSLDDFTYNKALQKITESFRVDQDAKQIMRSMKRK